MTAAAQVWPPSSCRNGASPARGGSTGLGPAYDYYDYCLVLRLAGWRAYWDNPLECDAYDEAG